VSLELVERQDRLMLDVNLAELAQCRDQYRAPLDLSFESTTRRLAKYFDENVYPVLTPLAVDPGHPFPMISNLSLNIAVYVRDDVTHEERSARVKVPNSLPRFLPANETASGACLRTSSRRISVDCSRHDRRSGRPLSRHPKRRPLTLEEDEADDLLVALEVELRRRRFGEALRVEIQRGMSEEFLKLLVDQLELDRPNVYVTDAPLGLHDLWSLYAIDRPDLKGEGWSPLTPRDCSTAITSVTSLPRFAKTTSCCTTPTSPSPTPSRCSSRRRRPDPKVVGIKQDALSHVR
jgi:polyphosphate kinase